MWPFSTPPQSSTLDQDFIQRYWDLRAEVGALDARLDERLDELERRYKRAEQSERRLDQKRLEEAPCPDEVEWPGIYGIARRARESRIAASRLDEG